MVESLVVPILPADPCPTTFEVFIKWYATRQSTSNTTFVAHMGNFCVCLSQSPSFGPWVIDYGASNHLFGNCSLFSYLLKLSIFHL